MCMSNKHRLISSRRPKRRFWTESPLNRVAARGIPPNDHLLAPAWMHRLKFDGCFFAPSLGTFLSLSLYVYSCDAHKNNERENQTIRHKQQHTTRKYAATSKKKPIILFFPMKIILFFSSPYSVTATNLLESARPTDLHSEIGEVNIRGGLSDTWYGGRRQVNQWTTSSSNSCTLFLGRTFAVRTLRRWADIRYVAHGNETGRKNSRQ